MKLKDLFEGLTSEHSIPALEISALTENSRKADASSVFVCICGAKANGHRFAASAYANGCRVFVAEEPLTLPDDAYILTVANTRITLARLACRLFGEPSRKMRIIGITGTKGKTTTAQLLSHILNDAGIPCGYIGTNGITYADNSLPTCNTTPDAVTLQSAFHDMLACGVKTAVVEVSSQALAQHRVDGTHFEALLFTNLSPDHIGPLEHASFEEYRSAKQRLFTDFDAKTVVYNADDVQALEVVKGNSTSNLIPCSSIQSNADLYIDTVKPFRDRQTLGITFSVHHKNNALPCVLTLSGAVNAQNAMLALATAVSVFKIPLTQAVSSLKSASVSGRSEVIPLPNGATAVIDYAHSAVSLRQILTVLREYRPSRLIALFGSIGERAQMRRAEMGHVAAELCDLCILTSDNPGEEPPEAIIEEIAAAFTGYNTPFWKIADRAEAIQKAVREAQIGDILLLAGKGHEGYQLIGKEKIPFCEKDILCKALQAVKSL